MALLLAGLVTTACDSVPLMAPSSSTISVTASAKIVDAGGTADISAFVAESGGTPVQNGTMVRFTTTLGRVDPVEVQTKNGLATTTFHAGDVSGTAAVRASSGGISTAADALEIVVGAAAVDTVTVRANPGTVPSTGGTVEVIAAVVGTGGRALANIPVNFATSAGSLASVRVLTDGAGEARTQLTTAQDSTITATVGAKSGTVTVTRQPAPIVQTVSLTATSETPVVGVGQRWNFTATLGSTDPSVAAGRFEWDFGDGSTASTNGNTTSHVFTTASQRRIVTVRVTLVNGQTLSATAEIIVGVF